MNGEKYLLRSTRSGVLWFLCRSHIVHTISYICVMWAFLSVSFQSSANCLTSHANLLNINFIIGHVHMMYVGYVCVAWHAPMEVGGQFYGVSSLPPPVHDGSHRAELRSPCLINKCLYPLSQPEDPVCESCYRSFQPLLSHHTTK